MATLLLLEDDKALLHNSFATPPLADHSWNCEHATWNSFAFENLDRYAADLVVAAATPNRPMLRNFLSSTQRRPGRLPTIAVLPEDPASDLLRLCIGTADDFVLCPLRPEELHGRITRLLGAQEKGLGDIRDRLNHDLGLSHLVGKDPRFLRELEKIPLAASSDAEVLITGETGTGKELCARAIHHLSARRNFPFVSVDCGALPDLLFENEMFGHERGAYTDAHRAQKGLVAMAEKGTLFLDEIDSLSPAAQAKLLRFLQDHGHKPLGAEQFSRADVRVIAATNRNLERALEDRMFRRDLFFRINVLGLHMVPLRERRGDIELLVQHFLELCSHRDRRCAQKSSPFLFAATKLTRLARKYP